jgi:hypothetical protein
VPAYYFQEEEVVVEAGHQTRALEVAEAAAAVEEGLAW